MESTNKVFWIKVILGILVGFTLGIIGVVGWLGVGIGFGLMVVSIPITLYVFKIKPEEVGGKRKLITSGLLQYFLAWIAFWTLMYTIMVFI